MSEDSRPTKTTLAELVAVTGVDVPRCGRCDCGFEGLPTVDTMLTIIGDNGHETNH